MLGLAAVIVTTAIPETNTGHRILSDVRYFVLTDYSTGRSESNITVAKSQLHSKPFRGDRAGVIGVIARSIRGDVKDILLPRPEGEDIFLPSSPCA